MRIRGLWLLPIVAGVACSGSDTPSGQEDGGSNASLDAGVDEAGSVVRAVAIRLRPGPCPSRSEPSSRSARIRPVSSTPWTKSIPASGSSSQTRAGPWCANALPVAVRDRTSMYST